MIDRFVWLILFYSAWRSVREGCWPICLLWHAAVSLACLSPISEAHSRSSVGSRSFRGGGWCRNSTGNTAYHFANFSRFVLLLQLVSHFFGLLGWYTVLLWVVWSKVAT